MPPGADLHDPEQVPVMSDIADGFLPLFIAMSLDVCHCIGRIWLPGRLHDRSCIGAPLRIKMRCTGVVV